MKHQEDQVSDSNESSTERNNNNENQGKCGSHCSRAHNVCSDRF